MGNGFCCNSSFGFNKLFNLKLDNKTLVKFAGMGEKGVQELSIMILAASLLWICSCKNKAF